MDVEKCPTLLGGNNSVIVNTQLPSSSIKKKHNFLEPKQTHHQHKSINTNILPTIAFLKKEIFACSELYPNTHVEANLDSFLLGKVRALPRNGRINHEVEWDTESQNR